MVQRLIVRALLARDLIARRFAFGDVDSDAGSAARHRAHAQTQRAQLAADDGRAGFLNRSPSFDGFARQFNRALVELQIARERLIERFGFKRVR
jgi:hypothetical protein